MTRRTVILLGVILALVGWFVYLRYFTFIANRRPEGSNIVAFGDSITAGQGVASQDSWVSLLEKRFGVPIVNAGVSGDTTERAFARFDKDVLARDPMVVIIELGGNDLLQGLPLDQARANLETMTKKLQDEGVAVVLLGVDMPMGVGGLDRVVKQVAKKYDTAYYPNILRGILGRPSMLLDGDRIHPNSAGHELIAKRVGKILRREIPSVFK
ncbi:arylesterase [Candidatus Sumerlaeota bacterium]|nr:arylesterase [Candidatus Sumerlaeota bacterium]